MQNTDIQHYKNFGFFVIFVYYTIIELLIIWAGLQTFKLLILSFKIDFNFKLHA